MSDLKHSPGQQQLFEVVAACCRALDDRKAEDIRVLHIGPKSTIADYFVIATGTSNPHLRALRNTLEKKMDELKVEVLGSQADAESGWIVIDAFDIIFHLFTGETRTHYSLEALWKDAEVIPLDKVLPPAKG